VNPLSLSLEGRDLSIWGIGVKRAIHTWWSKYGSQVITMNVAGFQLDGEKRRR